MVLFDEINIQECPNCHWPIGNYDRYCRQCGKLLPLPPNLDALEIREENSEQERHDADPHKYHQTEKEDECELPEEARSIYCTECGKKL